MGYQVSIDRNECIACGVASNLCPQAFILGEDNGKNRLIEKYSEEISNDFSTGVIPNDLHDCVRKAADACPVQAIIIQKK